MFRFGMIPTINKRTRVTRQLITYLQIQSWAIWKLRLLIVKTDISDHFTIIFATKNKIEVENL